MLVCACSEVRRVARLVTQFYSRVMGPDIEPPQFVLLSALDALGACGPAVLGRKLGIDKTTLSRNLALMEKKGWVESTATADARERHRTLAPAGAKILAATKPRWAEAQSRLRAQMSATEWQCAMEVFGAVAHAAQAAESRLPE